MPIDSIELVAYDPTWPEMAADEIASLKTILPAKHIIDIQHVGSTAIPGMIAKPVIDIQIAVDSLAAIKPSAITLLEAQGYAFWYENPNPDRMFFVKGNPAKGEKRTHHVHICEPGYKEWMNKIIFRDYLILHPEKAKEYADVKTALAKEHTHDREKYTDAKGAFIEGILQIVKVHVQ